MESKCERMPRPICLPSSPRGLLFRQVLEFLVSRCPFAIECLVLPLGLYRDIGEPGTIAGNSTLQLTTQPLSGVEIRLEGGDAILHVPIDMTDRQLRGLVADLPWYTAEQWVRVWAPRDGVEPLARRLERK
jgi:hypothetical protein